MDPEGQRLLTRLPALVPEGKPAVLVTVLAVEGSAPRRPGARMLCRSGRLLAGTIGGGHLEAEALRDADWADAAGSSDAAEGPAMASELHEEADEHGRTRRLARYPLGPRLGQCCGGVVWLHFAEVDAAAAARLAAAVQSAERDGREVVTAFAARTLREQPRALPTVLVLGAGHVAAALARCLQSLPWRVIVVDPRPEWSDVTRFGRSIEVACIEPMALLAAWGWLGAAAQSSQGISRRVAAFAQAHGRPIPTAPAAASTHGLVMTWDHALDRDLTEALLYVGQREGCGTAPLAYVGLIGSRSKIHSTRQRLLRRGVPEAVLQRLVAPIGLRLGERMLGGSLPGEIAVSVAAQLLSLQVQASAAEPSDG
jgi:xanthine dehydrogenase accessory factor